MVFYITMQASFTAYLHFQVVFIINDLFKRSFINALFQSLVAIGRCIAKLLFNTDKLIVLGHTVGTRK